MDHHLPQTLSTENDLSKGEQTRQQILEVSVRLFNEQGYHGTSMRQIAEQAGIALGGIYNHFASKEAIFENAILAYHPINHILPVLEQTRGDTVEEMVRKAADQVYDTLSLRQDFLNLMFIELVEFRARHFPRIFSEMFPRGLAFANRLKNKRGNLRQIPIATMLAAFLGLMFSYFLFRQFSSPGGELGDPKKTLGQIMDIFLYGILSDGPTA